MSGRCFPAVELVHDLLPVCSTPLRRLGSGWLPGRAAIAIPAVVVERGATKTPPMTQSTGEENSPARKQFHTNCCDAEWNGYNTCHCTSCHASFSNIKNFDRHRKYGKCVPPEDVGLVLGNRDYLCYCQPGKDEE